MTAIPAHSAAPARGTYPDLTAEPGHRFGFGKLLILLVALATPLGAFVADWNVTHIYNPNWPPHAKFHNAQTLNFAIVLASLSVFFLWSRRSYGVAQLRLAVTFAALYWVTQGTAILYPGTALVDPEYAGSFPVILGIELNQQLGEVVFLVLLAVGYRLERRRLLRVTDDARVVASSRAANQKTRRCTVALGTDLSSSTGLKRAPALSPPDN